MKLSAIIVILNVSCFAAFELQSVNTVSVAYGNIISIYPGTQNPAAQVESEGNSVRFDYSRLFGIKDLNFYETSFNHVVSGKSCAGFNLHTFGNLIYQEKTIAIYYALKTMNLFSAGLAIDLYYIAIDGYRHSATAGISFGICYYLNEQMTLATLFRNINRPSIYRKADFLPQSFTLGIRYRVIPKIEFSGELFKDTEFPFITRTAAMMHVFPFLDLMIGIQYHPNRYSGGLSLKWKKLRLDLAVQHHMVLPYTYFCGMGIGF